uniref:Uncharacterized protein n=1 Tax=Sphaerodactylus townsendi TaxID=933632 RepID=A0ACB8EH84_9SAUR
MAALEQLQSEVACSLCLEDFKEPVSISCGHNFCRPCIELCWAKAEGNVLCPQCRETIPEGTFRPNRVLGNIAELVKRLQSEAATAAATPVGNAICARHQEPLKLFCQQDEAPICVICRESRDHQSHKVLPIEEAAKDCKKLIQSELQKLKRKRENAISRQLQDGLTIKQHLEKIEVERDLVVNEFDQLHQFEQKQKSLFLDELQKLQEEMEEKQKADAEKAGHLSTLIEDMETICQQSDSEFLQDIKNILRRYVAPSAAPYQEMTAISPIKLWSRDFQKPEFTSNFTPKLVAFSLQNAALKLTLKTFKG